MTKKYIDAEKLKAEIELIQQSLENRDVYGNQVKKIRTECMIEFCKCIFDAITALQQEQLELPTIKGWIARDDADRLGLYDQKPTRKTELGAFSGIVHPWTIGDTWIGRFSLDQAAKPLFPNLCWTDDPMEVEIMFKPIQEQPEVDLEKEVTHFVDDDKIISKFVKYDDALLIARHFYELSLNTRKVKLPEIELDKFTEKIKTFQERYKHPEIVSIKGAMAFMARMFYQYPNVARQWYDSLPKATMD